MTYHDSYPDTLLVDGTDLQSLTGVSLLDITGLFAPALRRGSFEVTPRKRGQSGVPLVLDAFVFTMPVLIEGTDKANMIANLRALYAAVDGTNGLVALTRRLSKVGGGYDTHTAAGAFSGFGNFAAPSGSATDLTVDLQFTNLSGGWFSGSTLIVP